MTRANEDFSSKVAATGAKERAAMRVIPISIGVPDSAGFGLNLPSYPGRRDVVEVGVEGLGTQCQVDVAAK